MTNERTRLLAEKARIEAELLPCPFCGGEADMSSAGDDCEYVVCSGCGATSSPDATAATRRAWNTRQSATAPLIAALEATIELCGSLIVFAEGLHESHDYLGTGSNIREADIECAEDAATIRTARQALTRITETLAHQSTAAQAGEGSDD